MDYFATGAPMAVDTAIDADVTRVDALSQPAFVEVTTTDVPAGASLVTAYLYWAGTVDQQASGGQPDGCANTLSIDDEVVMTLPGATTLQPVTADVCHCVPGAPVSYDIQACRADITSLVAVSGMHGTYSVDQFAIHAENGSTDNGSFSLVLLYEEVNTLPPRRIAIYDGVEEFEMTTRTLQLASLDVDTPAQGEITWYVLDGDVGGTRPRRWWCRERPGRAPRCSTR